jgi:hypothetical protein
MQYSISAPPDNLKQLSITADKLRLFDFMLVSNGIPRITEGAVAQRQSCGQRSRAASGRNARSLARTSSVLSFLFIDDPLYVGYPEGEKEAHRERVFGHVRVSSPGQVHGDGFDRQAEAIADYARSHRLEVVRSYREESVSGTSDNRPALAELMVDLEENGHGVETVIIERLDRLACDLMVQEVVISDFLKPGFALISATEGPNLLSEGPARKLIRQMFGALAEYGKSMLVMKLRAARERVPMFEILLLQRWYNLSDVAAEESLYDRKPFLNDDTREKENIGQLWEEKSQGKGLFLLATWTDAEGRHTQRQIDEKIRHGK